MPASTRTQTNVTIRTSRSAISVHDQVDPAVRSIVLAFYEPVVAGVESTHDVVVDRAIAVAALSVPFLFVAWKKTEGGWRWRRGDEDLDDGTGR